MEQTKKCPYCGEEIMATAKKCRYCGEWLDGEAPQVSHQARTSLERTENNGNILKYIVIGIVVIVIAIIALLLISKTDDSGVKAETTMSDTIPPAAEPYSIDQVEANIAEYDANETPEEKAQEPWRIRLKELQGTYFRCDELNMGHDYGKIVISGKIITMYIWNGETRNWDIEFGSEFTLFKFHEDSYMDGYNLIYANQYRNDARMCSGDLDDNGKMDIWETDGVYWTKQ